MTARHCATATEAIANADAYLNNVALPNYSDLLDLLGEMLDNPDDVIQELEEIRGILYAAGR